MYFSTRKNERFHAHTDIHHITHTPMEIHPITLTHSHTFSQAKQNDIICTLACVDGFLRNDARLRVHKPSERTLNRIGENATTRHQPSGIKVLYTSELKGHEYLQINTVWEGLRFVKIIECLLHVRTCMLAFRFKMWII